MLPLRLKAGKLAGMMGHLQRAALSDEPLELTTRLSGYADGRFDLVEPAAESEPYSGMDPMVHSEGLGGRRVLGAALILLALLWVGFVAWGAGRALGSQPLGAPAIAQWLATAAGPLGLLGLVWLLFGRTRRREAEQFIQSVRHMRTEARSLEALLGELGRRIEDERGALSGMSEQLVRLGDDAGNRLGQVTRELGAGANDLARHTAALDRAAESARTDLGVLLHDLPQAEQTARVMAEQLRSAGESATSQVAMLSNQIDVLAERTRDADSAIGGASQRLTSQLAEVEHAGTTVAARLDEASSSANAQLDALLDRAGGALQEIRAGIDTQAVAVQALLDQSSASIGRAGIDAAEALGGKLSGAGAALDGLSARIAEQERASQGLIANVERSLAELDQRFVDLAAEGDYRAAGITSSIQRVRSELDGLAQQSASNDGSLEKLTMRTETLRAAVTGLHEEVGERLSGALGQAEGGAERLLAAVQAARPEVDWMREAAGEASDRLARSTNGLAEQHDRLAALLASLDDGVGGAEQRLGTLRQAMVDAGEEATRLQSATAPALVQAMVQVREAAGHAAERAREAIAAIIPQSAQQLSEATRAALQQAVDQSIRAQLADVELVAARAVESARIASDRLTAQMLTIGQTASALEAHIEQSQETSRAADSEAFARRTAMLIDSLHSASIDVGKILSTEVDDRSWQEYLKGDRGVFTRKAVRLLGASEHRSLATYFDSDREFQGAANRYVADFESMLRRVLGERDGGPLAVTLMSSDMGKLYAALASVVSGRR
jgi:chromosome segregation ATPase